MPPGIEINKEYIQKDLNKRKPGSSKFVTQRKEEDIVQINSGVFEGLTTGSPIALSIKIKIRNLKTIVKSKIFIDLRTQIIHTKKNMG